MSIKHFCDRCEREIEPWPVALTAGRESWDLCGACITLFRAWIAK